MNRLFSKIFLFFLLTIMTFVSCASTSVEENLYDSVEAKIDPKTKKVYDFEGMNIIIGDWYTNPSENPRTPAEKSLKDWRDWSCNTYNMNIQQQKVWGPQGYFDMVLNYCVANAGEGDNSQIYDPEKNYVFIIDESIAQKGVKAGLFYDLSKISNISYYDMVKYNQAAVMKLTRGLSFYSFGWEMDEPLEGVYFNKRILTEHGYTAEYLYDLQAEGKWTWDAFERICNKITKDTNYDGETDIWAMSSDIMDFANLAMLSNGTSFVGRDVNGIYYSKIINGNSIDTMYRMKKIWKKHQYPKKRGENENYFYKAFFEGKTAFLVGHQDSFVEYGNFQKMVDDYGFVCFPQGPQSNGNYVTISKPKLVVIPTWYDKARVEKIAKALDLWLTPMPNNDGINAWKKNYSGLFRDIRATEETLDFISSATTVFVDDLIIGLPAKQFFTNVLNEINTPEEEHFFTKSSVDILLADSNRYAQYMDKISDREFQIHLQTEREKIDLNEYLAEQNSVKRDENGVSIDTAYENESDFIISTNETENQEDNSEFSEIPENIDFLEDKVVVDSKKSKKGKNKK